uniref:Uncharacterized protein n=1 Tax=Anopheles culicifacies TaxID=139723 RepID=A0A182M5H6_9DIPT
MYGIRLRNLNIFLLVNWDMDWDLHFHRVWTVNVNWDLLLNVHWDLLLDDNRNLLLNLHWVRDLHLNGNVFWHFDLIWYRNLFDLMYMVILIIDSVAITLLVTVIMVATLIGSIYFDQVLDQDGVMNINGSLFLFLANMSFQYELPFLIFVSPSGLVHTVLDVRRRCRAPSDWDHDTPCPDRTYLVQTVSHHKRILPAGRPVLIHQAAPQVIPFPRRTLNHALLILGADETATEQARSASFLLAHDPAAVQTVVYQRVLRCLTVAMVALFEEYHVRQLPILA